MHPRFENSIVLRSLLKVFKCLEISCAKEHYILESLKRYSFKTTIISNILLII